MFDGKIRLMLFATGLWMVAITISRAQEASLPYFLAEGLKNAPNLNEIRNLRRINVLQEQLIYAQNAGLHIDATAELQVDPYFHNDGKVIDITTHPSPEALGYDIGITNGGLYSAQVNFTRNLFNQGAVDNLLFQNRLLEDSLQLSAHELEKNLVKNITDNYIYSYQLQVQEQFTKSLLKDLDNRVQVMKVLVSHGIHEESDYLLLQQEIASRELELQQIRTNRKAAISRLNSSSGLSNAETDSLTPPELDTLPRPNTYFFERKFKIDSLLLVADRKVFENQYMSQLQAYGTTGLNAVQLQEIQRRVGLSAGLRLTIPIYDGNQRRTYRQQHELRAEGLVFIKENKRTILENNLNGITDQLAGLHTTMQTLKTQIHAQKKILAIYQTKLVRGQVSIIDYLNVVQNYKYFNYTQMQLQTNFWLLQSQYNYLNW